MYFIYRGEPFIFVAWIKTEKTENMKSPKNNAVSFLRNIPLFEALLEPELERLEEMVRKVVVPKNEFIYRVGDTSETVFFLVKGTIKTGAMSEEGREVIKHVLHPLAMFGELCMVGERYRQDFAQAMNQSAELYALKSADLRTLMRSNHHLSLKLLNLVGARLRKVEDRLQSMIFKDARERIIDFLKESADKRGQRVGFEMLIKHSLTQQDIANITGTSRQTVTSVLNDLKKSNLIYFNRRSILIRDLARLA
jgi:CRP/FNR family transcriptional regulator, cyclic AMP receptor protein